jgi:alpha-beta hydrolase superfamily lysophospholipase
VLALWGENDLFVPAHRSAAVFRAAMSEAGNDRVEIGILPGATHLLTVAEGNMEFAPGYLDRMADWIDALAVR